MLQHEGKDGKTMENRERKTRAQRDPAAKDGNALPLKAASGRSGQNPAVKPATPPRRPEMPPRVAKVPGPSRLIDRPRNYEPDSKTLVVGRGIRVSGEIQACSRLLVEGHVEVSLADAQLIDIAPSGHFKGNVEVEEADISGVFEGELVARKVLTVRSGGRINGSVRYGRIVIESGGEVSGDMRSLTPEEVEAARNRKSDS